MKEIKLNEPGAGERIMELCEGPPFRPGFDQSISSYRDGKFLGGFVLHSFFGSSIVVQNGADDTSWCSRHILRTLFYYIFVQLRCHKAYATVASDNYRALEMDLRAGWRLEYVLRDAIAPGRHIMLLSMYPLHCPWIKFALQ